MDFRQIILVDREVLSEGGRVLTAPCRRAAACAILKNPLDGDLPALVDLPVQAGEILLAVAFLGGTRPNARIAGASQTQANEAIARMRAG